MKVDTVRLVASSLVVIIVIGYGMWQLGQLTASGIISGEAYLAVVGPLMGAAAAWVFTRDSATQGARSFEAGVTKGANAQPMTSTTTTAEGTATATTTPSSLTDTDA